VMAAVASWFDSVLSASKVNAPIVAIGLVMAAFSVSVSPGAGGWLGACLALLVLAIAVIDARQFIIPDVLNAAGVIIGIVHAAVQPDGDPVDEVLWASLRAALLALSFLALRATYRRLRGREGVGLGDVKLAAVAGAWLAWSFIPIAVEIAALSALCVYAVQQYVLRRPLRATARLPFGLFFAPAIWIAWLLASTLSPNW
jgi:leader peptidase (prepilin peptidase) / N-methyltransferase